MNALPIVQPNEPAENIIPLAIEKPKSSKPNVPQRFKIQEFQNRGGSTSWRVTGSKRDGTRIRYNFNTIEAAQCRQIELETEFLRGHAETTIRATKLSADQVQVCEATVIKLGDDWPRMLEAADYWLKHGKALSVANTVRLDDAYTQFETWLNGCALRDQSKKNLKRRVKLFINSMPNILVSDVTPETIEKFLDKRDVSAKAKDNDRRAVSRFFSWSIERPRRWIAMNPCREVKIEKTEAPPPAILTVEECKKFLTAARTHKRGVLAPYIALCLFAGIRPFEASRLTWRQINLDDGEIRLEGNQTKTGTSRVVAICPTLKAWLQRFKGKTIFPSNWRRDFNVIQRAAGYGTKSAKHPNLKPWPVDVMRHTAISHYFRQTESYGKTAEHFGNSEAIIKKHYQGRVSTQDTKNFYALLPGGKAAKKNTKKKAAKKIGGAK